MNDERLFRPDVRVPHYKWTSTVLDHLAERIATREQTGDKWTEESERFLAYWQRYGRIVFDSQKRQADNDEVAVASPVITSMAWINSCSST
jgi:hypothetical protein